MRLAIALLALAGCASPQTRSEPAQIATYPHKPGVTIGQRRQDVIQCQIDAAAAVPPNQQIITTPRYTRPGVTTQGQYVTIRTPDRTTGGAFSFDANAELREQAVELCMERLGYSLSPMPICRSGEGRLTERVDANTVPPPPRPGDCYVSLGFGGISAPR